MVKWSWSSCVAATLLHLCLKALEKAGLAASEGWWVEDLIQQCLLQPSVQLVSWALALWTCWSWRSLLHIYTNIVYILKLSFNLSMYFSSKRSKCFLPLAAVLGRSVLFSLTPLQKRRPSGNHLAAWSKAGICCIKEYVMFLCSFSHMQTPLFFACAQCQSWLSQGVQCSLKHWAVKTWALIVLIVCSCMKHSAGARSPWNFQGLQLPLNFWLWFEFNVLGM